MDTTADVPQAAPDQAEAAEVVTPEVPTEEVKRPARKKTAKKTKPKRKTKRHGITGRKWSWGYLNTFQPTTKWTRQGRLTRPTLRTTIPGCIYYAMKRIKRGSDATVLKACIEDGLKTRTKRTDLMTRVQFELRLLAKLGVIKRVKH